VIESPNSLAESARRASVARFDRDDPIVVVAARRTPIGKFMGALAARTSVELGIQATQAVLTELPPVEIDRVVFGLARPAGVGPNPARQVTVRAGLGTNTPAETVNMACASGLEAIALGARLISTGEAQWVVAGGMESMSRAPFLLDRFRGGYRLGHGVVEDSMYRDGFSCPLAGQLMGETAEALAREYEIGREEQDAFALESQQRAARAAASGRFDRELVTVAADAATKAPALDRDEQVRPDVTLEALGKLSPVFSRDGTVTAGNSSGLTDGAAVVVLTRASLASAAGVPPLARFVGLASAGVDPRVMGIGPVPAVRRLLSDLDLSIDAMDLIELNEAFAAQVLACDRELKFDRARLNVNGGAIALGHPIGCSGARIVVTLLHEMQTRGAARGLATLCVSGGLGVAALFER